MCLYTVWHIKYLHKYISTQHVALQQFHCFYLSHSMTKPAKRPVHPAKTRVSLGIRPVLSVVTVRMKKPLVLIYPLSAQRRLRSALADAQADLSLCWAHRSFCWFFHAAAHFSLGFPLCQFVFISNIIRSISIWFELRYCCYI